MTVKIDKDKFISQSPSGFKQEFTSGFMNEFSNKWDNLFLYKNGFMDLFASNKSIVDYLKDPKDKIDSNIRDTNSFVKEFVNTFQNVKKFNVSGYVTFFDKETEGEFKFCLSKTSTYANLKKHQTFIPSNNLLMKIDPAIVAKVNFENIDQTFLGKDFNTIDFSKTIFHTKNYTENIHNLVNETSNTTNKTPNSLKNYNNEDFKNTLTNLERSLTQTVSSFKVETVTSTSDMSQSKEAKDIDINTAAFLIALSAATIPITGLTLSTARVIAPSLPLFNSFNNEERYKVSDESIKSTIKSIKNSNFKDFSSTVGFSVKSLTVKDLREINNQYIKITTNVVKKREKIYSIDGYSSVKTKYKTTTNITYDIPEDLSNEVFTISYFSPFNFSGNNTELKKIYKTDTKIEVKQNPGGGSKNHQIKKIGSDIHTSAYSVTVMNNDVLKKNLKNYKHRLGQYTNNPNDKDNNLTPAFIKKVENINKDLNKSSSDLGSLIKNIEYIEGFINIDIEYIKLNKTSGDYIENEIYQNSYLFDPVICLETVNQTSNVLHLTNNESYPITSFDRDDEKETGSARIEVENKNNYSIGGNNDTYFNIIKNKSVGEQKFTTSDKNVLAYACKKTYSVFIGDVFKACEIVDNLRLRSLSQLYGSKFFYTNDEGFNYIFIKINRDSGYDQDTENSSDDILYPEFQPNFNLKFNSSSTDKLLKLNSKERKNNSNFDLSDPENVQNAKKSIGDLNREREPKKDESLKGSKEEKVLKISKSDITLENNKETKSAEEITFQKSLVSGGEKYREAISKGRNIVNDVGLELDYVKLNNIEENNAKGKINKTGSKNVVYNMGHNALIKRRGNIQPKLVSLLNEAFNITQKSYPSLSKVEIYSGGSLPITLWGKIVDIILNYNGELKFKDLNYKFLAGNINTSLNLGLEENDGKLAFKQIKSLLRRNNDKLDSNHSFGFGCDIKLKRKLSDGKEKYICLWQPNDNEDFIILKYFIKACFDLGASSVGAGLNYMSYPDPVKYDIADGLVIGTDKKGKKIKRKNIELNVQSAHKKYVLDENNLLIRKNGSPSNGIHVDIVKKSINYLEDIDDDDMEKFSNYIVDAKEIRQSFSNGLIYIEKEKNEFKNNKSNNDYLSKAIKSKTSNPTAKTVWGQSSTAASSESWLKEIIVRSDVAKGFELSEITTENASERTIDLFKKKHDKVDDHGSVIDKSVVSIKSILKKV